MVVASPLVLSSSSQGWDSSTGLENWTFPRCRRPDNTWNAIREFFRTVPPKAGSPEPSFSLEQASSCTFLHKRQPTDPKLLSVSLMLQLLKANWNSEVQTLGSDLPFSCAAWCGAEGPPGRSSSSAQWQGLIPAAIPPWEHIPNILSSLVLSLLCGWPWKYCSAWQGRCPGGTLPLWSPRSSPLKSQTALLKKPSIQTGQAEHLSTSNPAGMVRGERGRTGMLSGEIPTHCFFLSGESHAKTKTVSKQSHKDANLPGQNQLF